MTVARHRARGHGFEVHDNISGYTGGNIVATFGQPQARRVHAIQLEINASLLMTTSRDEYIAHVSRGGIPEKAADNILRVRQCLEEVVLALPSVLAAVHEGDGQAAAECPPQVDSFGKVVQPLRVSAKARRI